MIIRPYKLCAKLGLQEKVGGYAIKKLAPLNRQVLAIWMPDV
ncbi:hypothetical protein [Desulfovermiculus halophilus]|jgi:hypothetical protein|nr:hypothetical protein [Desulfovermiculus halophilus]